MRSRSIFIQVLIISLFIIIAAFSRLIPHEMNLTPVGAIALFGGAYLGMNWKSFFIPLAAIFASDLLLNNYVYAQPGAEFQLFYDGALWVYFTYGLIVLLGAFWLKKVTIFRVVTGSLGAAVIFFLVTNFACWPGTTYTPDMKGLMDCYIAGIPFFRGTLMGDLIFSGILFGAYSFIQHKYFNSLKSAERIETV
ncbi:MAG: hypothetical protein J5I59_11495 [Saprospiraceae bacterium]|nr:hypothetical protein [Saprospiraceae bacterium]